MTPVNKPSPQPPRWAVRVLNWLHPVETLEEVEGDFAELYTYWYNQHGKRKADLRYVLAVLSVLPPFVRRRKPNHSYAPPSLLNSFMLRNYFKIAIRHLAKQKGSSFINMFGLSVGMSCFILLILYTIHELSFDRFHTHASTIYRIYQWDVSTSQADTYLPMPLGPALKREVAGIQEYVRIRDAWRESFIKSSQGVSRAKISFADPQFFTLFSFPFKEGNAATALSNLNDVVVSEETAMKIWGKSDVIGKTLEIKVQDKFELFEVTAVTENIPSTSSIHFQLMGNFSYLTTVTPDGRSQANDWTYSSSQTYIQVSQPNSIPAKEALQAFYRKYNVDPQKQTKEKGSMSREHTKAYNLQPLQAIHTDPVLKGAQIAAVDPKTIYMLLSIAFGILLIACINFNTLAIGHSANRSKEVGIRKVMGESKTSIAVQFMTETLVLVILSTFFSLLLVHILIPYFNQLSGKKLSFSFIQFPELIPLLAGLVLMVGFLAGSYPAFILSGLKPVEVMKTKWKLAGSNFFTNALVTAQFTLSVALIISTVIMLQQLEYMQSKTPGFKKENIVVVDADGTWPREIYPFFKQELAAYPGIVGVTGSDQRLTGSGFSNTELDMNGKTQKIYEFFVADDFISVMDVQLLAGRNFHPELASDTVNAVIINEALMKEFGWTLENVIGQPITAYRTSLQPVIIGVVKDFNFQPFRVKVEPQLFHQFSKYRPYKYFVAIQAGDPSQSLALIEASWKKIVPDFPFKYSFLDEDLNRLYESESQWSKIIGWAGGICILLACMGLLGLTSLAVTNRTKEIGIRKVLGASVSNLWLMLTKSFVALVFLSCLMAIPLSYLLMNSWLQQYAYRIEISFWIGLITGIAALVIMLLTVSYQAISVALMNPVKTLRNE